MLKDKLFELFLFLVAYSSKVIEAFVIFIKKIVNFTRLIKKKFVNDIVLVLLFTFSLSSLSKDPHDRHYLN